MEHIYAIVSTSGLILGLSIAFFNQWMTSDSEKQQWEYKDLPVLIPLFLGEIGLIISIYIGLNPGTQASKASEESAFTWMIIGITLIMTSKLISVICDLCGKCRFLCWKKKQEDNSNKEQNRQSENR